MAGDVLAQGEFLFSSGRQSMHIDTTAKVSITTKKTELLFVF